MTEYLSYYASASSKFSSIQVFMVGAGCCNIHRGIIKANKPIVKQASVVGNNPL